MSSVMRIESQTPAQYAALRREFAHENGLCENCSSIDSSRRPVFFRDRKTGKYRLNPETLKRVRKRTCEYCLAQKSTARKRRKQSGSIVERTFQGEKTIAELAGERTARARLEEKCITCRTNPVTPGQSPRRGGRPYSTCARCRATCKARTFRGAS